MQSPIIIIISLCRPIKKMYLHRWEKNGMASFVRMCAFFRVEDNIEHDLKNKNQLMQASDIRCNVKLTANKALLFEWSLCVFSHSSISFGFDTERKKAVRVMKTGLVHCTLSVHSVRPFTNKNKWSPLKGCVNEAHIKRVIICISICHKRGAKYSIEKKFRSGVQSYGHHWWKFSMDFAKWTRFFHLAAHHFTFCLVFTLLASAQMHSIWGW